MNSFSSHVPLIEPLQTDPDNSATENRQEPTLINLPNFLKYNKVKPKYKLDKSAFANLSQVDQASFESFALGPAVELPFEFLHHAFEYWATKQPLAVAAMFAEQSICYKDLNHSAQLLAIKLVDTGVQKGDNVGLFVKRSIDMLVAMLAIFKVGATYIPLDIGVVPTAQIATIIQTAQLKVVLTFDQYRTKVKTAQANPYVITIDGVCRLADSVDCTKIKDVSVPLVTGESDQHCAFILFTSGTTGRPNGVQVSHKNLCNILLTSPGNMTIKPGVKVSQILNIGFDMSAWEIWGALCNGGTLVIRGKSVVDAVEQADVVIATPSILDRIPLEQVLPMSAVAVAGEPCPRPLADKWSNICAFYNSCGPTETTIINTAQRHFSESKLLSIGSPTPNNSVYILDENMQPCAIGEIGEMWAGGDGVSLGYLDNQQLTNERYKPDPFLAGNKMMFRTRDLGRWTSDGQLEHLGRTDDQVKVRGFRVELDAVSNLLEQCPTCQRAVTLKLNNRELIAFVMPANVDTSQAKETLAKLLPYYSVPEFIIAMDALPLTDRGKVDKSLLQSQYFNQVNQLVNLSSAKEGLTCR